MEELKMGEKKIELLVVMRSRTENTNGKAVALEVRERRRIEFNYISIESDDGANNMNVLFERS